MPGRVLLRHPSSLEHETGAHPESPRRIVAIERALSERDWLGWDVRLSPAAARAKIETIHPAPHIDRIEALCRHGGGLIDMDTVVSPGSFEAALHAAGGAIAMVDALLGGERARLPARVADAPDAIAVRDGDDCWTYAALNHAANRIAHALRRRDLGRQRLVAICAKRSAVMAAGVLHRVSGFFETEVTSICMSSSGVSSDRGRGDESDGADDTEPSRCPSADRNQWMSRSFSRTA